MDKSKLPVVLAFSSGILIMLSLLVVDDNTLRLITGFIAGFMFHQAYKG